MIKLSYFKDFYVMDKIVRGEFFFIYIGFDIIIGFIVLKIRVVLNIMSLLN